MNNTLKAILLFSITFGCAEKPEQKRQSTDSVSTGKGYIDIDADIIVYEDIPFTKNSTELLGLNSGSYTFSLINAPDWMTIDENSGAISGTPTDRPTDGIENVTIKAVDASDDSISQKEFSVGIYGDPLRVHSWHLNNTGQKTFSDTSGVAGKDAGIIPVFNRGIFGEDIRIAVSDSGLEITHEDLLLNMLSGEHRDYSLPDPPYIGSPVTTTAHGTAVAGIIAARGWNNLGVTGIAPYAKIAGFQFLDSEQSEEILIDQASGNYDIFNFSYGDAEYEDALSSLNFGDHLRSRVLNGRSGLGTFFVKAAGNEFIVTDDFDDPTICVSHNANFPMENESPFLITVGAINAEGKKASYSSAGSNLWVVAPGGEFGIFEPAILTTDLQTCFKGISSAVSNDNPFEYDHPLNSTCSYTSTMNGTSAATPLVTGVIALILEANPNLNWREVKHILAMTANQVDPQTSAFPAGKNHPSSNLTNQGCIDLSLFEHQYELGWVENQAGVKFNNFYGFGLVNAENAVKMAKGEIADPLNFLPMGEFTELNPDFINGDYEKINLNLSIPSNDSNGITDTLTISNTNLTVETLQVRVNVTHPRSGEIGVELTKDGVTRSILMNINNSFLLGDDANLDIVLATHAFYGESADGVWEIKVIDGSDGNAVDGTLNSWKINILGH